MSVPPVFTGATHQASCDKEADKTTSSSPDHSLLARIQNLWIKSIPPFPHPFSAPTTDPSPHRPLDPPKKQTLLSSLPKKPLKKILDTISNADLGRTIKVCKMWLDVGSLIRKKHIIKLRTHSELQKFFPFFFLPLPKGTVDEITNTEAAESERVIHTVVKHILKHLPDSLSEACEFKKCSLFIIIHNPDLLASLLKIAYEFSLVRAFYPKVKPYLLQIRTLSEKAQVVRKWITDNVSNITELDCHSCGMLCLPNELCSLTRLTTLYLPNNYITQLPRAIGKLSKLTILNLSSNRLTTLPSDIENLSNLTTLNLSSNYFFTLPNIIGKLSSLIFLYLSNNPLSKLPNAIGELTNLTHLFLSYNRLTKLPAVIGNLVSLTDLSLYDNKLTKLPEEMLKLKNLKDLRLADNNFTTPFTTRKWLETNLPQTKVTGLSNPPSPLRAQH